ncbi:helix-turn-helix transcriptional regulator [Inhella gelatinilytica]|uniref:AlpA family phage regulatory protein n=1 Tax=Inhella gelatinilytica TaxID=2795030 RepID=A0A931IYC9_9BURK|nr:AlpA family phage regulatory protein [Inhella gelatinilytica]MBH9553334.1 AlpA family phage regulatory protein [Inhella gelatinilytica]
MTDKNQSERFQPLEAASLPDALLKLQIVEAVTGLSRPSIYRRMAVGDFPQPVRLGRRCTRWPAAAVRDWIKTQQACSN